VLIARSYSSDRLWTCGRWPLETPAGSAYIGEHLDGQRRPARHAAAVERDRHRLGGVDLDDLRLVLADGRVRDVVAVVELLGPRVDGQRPALEGDHRHAPVVGQRPRRDLHPVHGELSVGDHQAGQAEVDRAALQRQPCRGRAGGGQAAERRGEAAEPPGPGGARHPAGHLGRVAQLDAVAEHADALGAARPVPARAAGVGHEDAAAQKVPRGPLDVVGQPEGGRQVLAAEPHQAEHRVGMARAVLADQRGHQRVGDAVVADRHQQARAAVQRALGDLERAGGGPGHRGLGDHAGAR
jgi:hypothetical protein